MEEYLIDTNIVSDYFSGNIPSKFSSLMDDVINAVPNLSVITQIELLCWNTYPQTSKNVQDFISDSNVFDISQDVISNCVKIRKHKKVKTPDAIISAPAIALGYTLIINNSMDFKNIPGLKIISLLG